MKIEKWLENNKVLTDAEKVLRVGFKRDALTLEWAGYCKAIADLNPSDYNNPTQVIEICVELAGEHIDADYMDIVKMIYYYEKAVDSGFFPHFNTAFRSVMGLDYVGAA